LIVINSTSRWILIKKTSINITTKYFVRKSLIMDKQMCWLIDRLNGQTIVLHLREYAHQPWKPYNTYSQYSVPDYRVPRGSKGWATYQHLRQAGWNLIPTAQANSYAPSVNTLAKKAA
jgi:hypothetical protein